MNDYDDLYSIPEKNLTKVFQEFINDPEANAILATMSPSTFVTKIKQEKYRTRFRIVYDDANKEYKVSEKSLIDFVNAIADEALLSEMWLSIKTRLVEIYWDDKKRNFQFKLAPSDVTDVDKDEHRRWG